jgi:hypothetical protein
MELGGVYTELKRFAEAEPPLLEAQRVAESVGRPTEMAALYGNLANYYSGIRNFSKAEYFNQKSLAICTDIYPPDNPVTASIHYNFADSYREEGKLDLAYEQSQHAVDTIAHHMESNATQGSEYLVAEALGQRKIFVQNGALAGAVSAAAPAQAEAVATSSFAASQLAKASIAGQAISRMAARFAGGNDALAAAIRSGEALAERKRQLDAELIAAAGRPQGERNAGTEASLRAELASTDQRLSAFGAQLAQEFPAYAELTSPRPLPVSEVQNLLAPDEAMLVYLIGDDASWLWVVRRDAVGLVRLEIGSEALLTEVTALRERLDPEKNGLRQAFPATRAYDLYEKVFAPAAALLSGAHQILVVPDGALESLPFEVLVTRRPERDPSDDHPEDNRQIAWLARERAVTVLPTVSVLRALRRFAANAGATSAFVGVGDPVLSGPPQLSQRVVAPGSLLRGAMANVDRVRDLSPLPQTSTELRAVARLLGAGENDLYLRERASEPVLRRVPLHQYRVVEFATHGLIAGELVPRVADIAGFPLDQTFWLGVANSPRHHRRISDARY